MSFGVMAAIPSHVDLAFSPHAGHWQVHVDF